MEHVAYNLQYWLPHVITYHIVMPGTVNWEEKLGKEKKSILQLNCKYGAQM